MVDLVDWNKSDTCLNNKETIYSIKPNFRAWC
jgi:hypothetical protein